MPRPPRLLVWGGRTRLLLVAAALVAMLAAAGVGTGVEWEVYPGDPIDGADVCGC